MLILALVTAIILYVQLPRYMCNELGGKTGVGCIPTRPASAYQVHTKNNKHTPVMVYVRENEKQWIRRSESTSAKREWIWIYESIAFECVLRLNTPQINRNFL